MSFFSELRRRNVFRVGFAYAVVAWLLLQISDTLVPALHLPEWFLSGVALLLTLGFPVSLIFAWAFELTPEGLKKDSNIEPGRSIARVTGRKMDFLIIGLLVIALSYFGYDKFVLDPQRDISLMESAASTESDSHDVPSIAVLAFVNMSDDSSNEYFSEGLSEELLNLLVKIPELRVAARTSSFSYKGTDAKADQIGLELNVTHLLEGSVRKSGDRIRITAQLIEARSGYHLWSNTFDRTLDDIFAIQDEIAANIVRELKVSLLGDMPVGRTTEPEVYSLYLQGKYLNTLGRPQSYERAIDALKQALDIDPNYAPAWVGIQLSYSLLGGDGKLSWEESQVLSLDAAYKALAIDENLASAWAGLAYLKRNVEWDWSGARAAIDRALELEPNNAEILRVAASLAGTFGRLDDSIALFERSIGLDPLELSSHRALGIRYMNAGRFEDSLQAFRRVQALNPDYRGIPQNINFTYLASGDPERALIELQDSANDEYSNFILVASYSDLGNEAAAQSIINQMLEESSTTLPGTMAAVYAWRGENDLAFEWLEKAYQQRDLRLPYLLVNIFYRNLTTDPRYAIFIEKLGLLEEWQSMPPEYGGPPTR